MADSSLTHQAKGGKKGRKVGRNFRWAYSTHSVTAYMSRAGRSGSKRGNLVHRRPGTCANCGTKQGPFRAGPLPGTKVCWVGFKDRNDSDLFHLKVEECMKRRSVLDAQRYPAIVRAA